MGFYKYEATRMDGQKVTMSEYKGKVVLIVNTASKCGFTPQFEGLEQLYQTYKESGFEILGFPCNQFAKQDAGTNGEIETFCKRNYGVSFTMFEKVKVNGSDAHPLYQYLKQQAKGRFGNGIKWNFTKFLVDSEGNVVKRYAPTCSPLEIKSDIEALLK